MIYLRENTRVRYISGRVSLAFAAGEYTAYQVVTSSEGRSARPVYSRKLRSHGARWPAIWRIPPCQTTLHYARCRFRGILMKCRLTRGRTALYLSHLREPCTVYTVYRVHRPEHISWSQHTYNGARVIGISSAYTGQYTNIPCILITYLGR